MAITNRKRIGNSHTTINKNYWIIDNQYHIVKKKKPIR